MPLPSTFALPHNFIENMQKIPLKYTESKKKTPPTRNSEITFLKFWLDYIHADKNFDHPIEALRVLFSANCFLMNGIEKTYSIRSPSNSILYSLLKKTANISDNNPIDDASLFYCLSSAQVALEKIMRQQYTGTTKPLMLQTKLNEYKRYLNDTIKALEAKEIPHYPLTNFFIPLFEKPFTLAGYACGMFFGECASRSANALPAHYALTAAVGGGMYLMKTSSMGTMLLAPTAAAQMLERALGISVAIALGKGMGCLGALLGFVTGRSLDAACSGIGHVIHFAKDTYFSTPGQISGISLIDGSCRMDETQWGIVDTRNIPTEYVSMPISITHRGFSIKGEGVDTEHLWNSETQPNADIVKAMNTPLFSDSQNDTDETSSERALAIP